MKEEKGSRKGRRQRSWLVPLLNTSFLYTEALTEVLTRDENGREQNFNYFTIVWLTDTFKSNA